ncbi:Prenyltransferase/squalene oxidase [Planctomycetales bacterium 10988]|nr:Prenyltransferase/squalene oxidase [Planctomycetales bacterium 10988]
MKPSSWSRRFALKQSLLGLAAVFQSRSSLRAFGKSQTPSINGRHITPEIETSIAKGLDWLASRQMPDGGFGRGRSYSRNVGVCALSGLAFLSSCGPRGPYRQEIARCIRYLLGREQTDGFIVEEEVCTHAPLYGHGYSTLFLGQAYGEFDEHGLRDCLQRATELTLRLQDSEGAWQYSTEPDDADTSITTCMMMSLFSAHQAGISVPREAIERGVSFLQRCQNPDGGFRYRLIDPPVSLFPRSAAVIVTLIFSGLLRDHAVEKAFKYLWENSVPEKSPRDGRSEYYYYGLFYATHAAWLAGDEAWDAWFPQTRDELLKRQTSQGKWEDSIIGDEYATAMALLILQFPLSQIPLFAL